MKTATINIRWADLPEVRRLVRFLLAEHVALNSYLVAGLLHNQTGHHWSDLLVAHDAVAVALAERRGAEKPT